MDVSPADYELIRDEYGNQYAEFDFSNHPAGTTKTIKIDYRLTVNELAYDLSACEGEVPDDFIQPELHIESINPQIVALASELSRGKKTACRKVRAFYDYIGDELVYTYNGKNWGAQAALGTMGADCTEYTSLLVALSRSQIFGAIFEGLLFSGETERAPGTCLVGCTPAWRGLGDGRSDLRQSLGGSRYLFCSSYPRPYYCHPGTESIDATRRQLLDAHLLAGRWYADPRRSWRVGDQVSRVIEVSLKDQRILFG
jgi:hypothetical protein